MARGLAAIAALALIAFEPSASEAGQASRVSSGKTARWVDTEIVLVPILSSQERSIPSSLLVRELSAAAAAWNEARGALATPTLRVARGAPERETRQDTVSTVSVQTRRRCSEEHLHDVGCYAKDYSAITHAYPLDAPGDPGDGAIHEADIEINGVDVDWEIGPRGSPRLRAVLLHELGHVLGLEHACGRRTGGGAGDIPSCALPQHKRSMMYPDALEPGRPLVLAPTGDEHATLESMYGKRSTSCAGSSPRRGFCAEAYMTLAALLVLLRRRRTHRDRV